MRAHRGPRASALLYALLGFSSCAVGEDVSEGVPGTGGAFPTGGSPNDAGKVDGRGATNTGGGSSGGASGSGAASGGSGGAGVSGSGGTDVDGSTGGGTSGSAGMGGTVGASGSAGTDSGSGCPAGRKLCGGICVDPSPGLGCSLANCTPCAAAPANSTAVCTAGACDFTCASGYRKNAAGTGCESVVGAGGAAGTGGTGGSAGTAGTGGSGGTYDGIIGKGCTNNTNCTAIPGGICDGTAKVCVKACMSHDNCGCPTGTTNAMIAAGGCRAACVNVAPILSPPNLLCVRVCKAPNQCEGNLTTCSTTTAGYSFCG